MANSQSRGKRAPAPRLKNPDGSWRLPCWVGQMHQPNRERSEDSVCFAPSLAPGSRGEVLESQRICLCTLTAPPPIQSGNLEPRAIASSSLRSPTSAGKPKEKRVKTHPRSIIIISRQSHLTNFVPLADQLTEQAGDLLAMFARFIVLVG